MRFSYLVELAFKNLTAHKMRSVLTMTGVTISVGFIVFLISLGIGLQRISTNQIANLEAMKIIDVSIAKSKIMKIDEASLDKLRGIGNMEAVVPFFNSATKIKYGSSEIEGIVYGKDIEFLQLEEPKIVSGKKFVGNNQKEAIINTAALEVLGQTDILGKYISTETGLRSEVLFEEGRGKVLQDDFKIVGVIEDKTAPYIYVPLSYFTQNGVVNFTGAKAKASSKEAVDLIKSQIENLGFKTSSVKETVDQINQFFGIFQMTLLIFGVIATIVACLGMFNTLTISLLEKTREVGFMKALGTTKKDIYRMFLAEAIFIGSLGTALGTLGGYLLGQAINASVAGLAKATGNVAVELFYTPGTFVLLIFGVSLLVSFLTGFYPSKRAATINPLDALRYE